MKAKRVWSAVLCAGLALSMCVNAGAAAQNDELRAAASYVSEQGVMVGDQNGDMALDQTLSRTELAVILTRITVNPEHLEAERELYTRKCEFPDVPEWARLYVGYLSFNGHWSRRCRRGGSRRKYPAGRDREFGFRPPRNHLQYRWLDQYPIGWVPLCSTGWRCDPL